MFGLMLARTMLRDEAAKDVCFREEWPFQDERILMNQPQHVPFLLPNCLAGWRSLEVKSFVLIVSTVKEHE